MKSVIRSGNRNIRSFRDLQETREQLRYEIALHEKSIRDEFGYLQITFLENLKDNLVKTSRKLLWYGLYKLLSTVLSRKSKEE